MNALKSLFAAIAGIFRQTLTGKDGQTHDIARHSWALGTASIIGGAIWNAIHQGAVDLMTLASALGLVSGAGAVAVKAKETSEPEPPAN